MALSNIFREPQREITETVVGLVVASVIVYLDYEFAVWFQNCDWGSMGKPPLVIGFIAGALLVPVAAFALHLVHETGDLVCDILDDFGVRLRPRDRK